MVVSCCAACTISSSFTSCSISAFRSLSRSAESTAACWPVARMMLICSSTRESVMGLPDTTATTRSTTRKSGPCAFASRARSTIGTAASRAWAAYLGALFARTGSSRIPGRGRRAGGGRGRRRSQAVHHRPQLSAPLQHPIDSRRHHPPAHAIAKLHGQKRWDGHELGLVVRHGLEIAVYVDGGHPSPPVRRNGVGQRRAIDAQRL